MAATISPKIPPPEPAGPVEAALRTFAIVGGLLVPVAALLCPARGQNITPYEVGEVQALLKAAFGPSGSMPVWSSRRDAPPASYRRNPAVWTGAAVDLTGKAVWNSHTGNYGTTAISPRHVVYANHVNGLYPPGTVVRFVTADNRAIERIVVDSRNIGATDLDVSTLDSALPDTIHWYKVMPKHWFLHCTRGVPGIPGAIPCLVMDGNTQSVAVKDLAGFAEGVFVTGTPPDPLRRAFTRELHLGDSGSPMFLLIGGELVLDGIYHTAQGGVEVSSHVDALDTVLEESGCRVTVVDISRFASR